jgi:LysR family transcriptional regulator, nod-box dependent transcriptional activator
MRLDNFDLNLLVAFDVLLEERSVTRAAERLHLTQSAMSAALKRLRESFQDELLVLHGKRMIPTQHALSLAPQVSEALARLKGLIASSTRFNPATSTRQFRIDASDYVTTVLLRPLIELLNIEAPGIRLNLSMPDGNSSPRLEAGAVDLILTPDRFIRNDEPCELLFEERHVVVGWAENPLMHEPMTCERFLQAGHVTVRISDEDTFIEAILLKQMPERRIAVSAQSFIQIPWLVRGTNRLAVMHERLAKVAAPIFDLAISEPPISLPTMREMMQSHAARSTDEGLVWLRQRIRQFADRA